jgi:hypothetical protein
MLLHAPYRCNACARRFADWYLGSDTGAKDHLGFANVLGFWAGTIAMWLATILLFLILLQRIGR